jgi:DNA adenine methylase
MTTHMDIQGSLNLGADKVNKTIWGSPAGKKRLAKKLAAMVPTHKVYVEPFVGSGAVLFEKEPSEVEVINDIDPEIAEAFGLLKKLNPDKVDLLRSMSWVGDEARFKRILNMKPATDVEKLYRFLYVTHFSYGKLRGSSFSPVSQGVEARTIDRIEAFAPRLKGVEVYAKDYAEVVERYDSPETFFFFDPPYAGYNVNVGESDFDEERFFKILQGLQGQFLLTYGIRGILPKLLKGSRFKVQRIRTPRSIGAMRGAGGPSVLTQLLVSNYTLPQKRAVSAKAEAADQNAVATEQGAEAFERDVQLIKGADPDDERYVLGVVLEPETVDAQGDIYSAQEVRHSAHRFMEEFGGLGLMHRLKVNGQVKLLESYLAPQPLEVAGQPIQPGTWLLAVRVLDDALWQAVKDGGLSGFSIGGSARRVQGDDAALTKNMKRANDALEDLNETPAESPSARLVDMVVEEVSLVDHAANRRRFLIIKRDLAMPTMPIDKDDDTLDSDDFEIGDCDDADEADDLGDDPGPVSDAALGRIEALLVGLDGQLRTLDGAIKSQALRLTKLEKASALPNSRPLGEQPLRPTRKPADGVSWPLDINHPLDRASVDKSLSFHDD